MPPPRAFRTPAYQGTKCKECGFMGHETGTCHEYQRLMQREGATSPWTSLACAQVEAQRDNQRRREEAIKKRDAWTTVPMTKNPVNPYKPRNPYKPKTPVNPYIKATSVTAASANSSSMTNGATHITPSDPS
jgi:hypothetical protein